MIETLFILSSLIQDDAAEEITVTALRTPIELSKSTSKVTVITKADIEKAQYQTVADILKSVAGLSVSRAGSVGGQTQIRPRGAEANHLLVMIDGVEMNDPAAGDEVQWELFSALSIERIEIIKSPVSASWGSDALAGVVNIITTSGEQSGISLAAEYGSFDTKALRASLTQSSERISVQGSLSYKKSEGINVSRQGGETDGYEDFTASLKATVQLAEATTLITSLRHSSSENAFDGTDFLTGFPADGDLITESAKTYFSAKVDHQMNDDLFITAKLGYSDTQIDNYSAGSDNGTTGSNRFSVSFDTRYQVSDWQVLTLALDHEKTDFTQTGDASPWGDPNQDQSVKVTGLTADTLLTPTDAFTLALSLRKDWHSDFDDFTSWRAGLSYSLSNQTRFFSSISRGQKAPTFLERFGFFPDQFIGNPTLSPEESITFEAGIEHAFTEAVSASVTAYTSDLKNEINGFAFDTTSFLYTAVNKDEESKRKGFEFTLDWQLSETTSFTGSYTYTDATETDSFGTRSQELRRPKHTATFGLTTSPMDHLDLTISGVYTGKATDLFFPPWPNPSERVSVGDYLLLRVASTYQLNDSIALFGRLENALDAEYEDIYGFSTPGFAAYGGVKITF
ncbi:TonB-dependent receptor [Temperatibacter marinus]|uniref:TonB-dependent receptor n=1 Tax=Temperatibacter marinus TaxID=1456591 RepID=A0AA52HAI0_9PROT|nr:TonB-dependent receptor [Temperatibacter marinus]WND03984.1 TonB-dependent receptor [Temperatibacter marinus]